MGILSRIIKAPFEIAKDVTENLEEIITGDDEDDG